MALIVRLDSVIMGPGMFITGQCTETTGGAFDWQLLRVPDLLPPLNFGTISGLGPIASFSFVDELNENDPPHVFTGFNQQYIVMFRDATDAAYPGTWFGPSLASIQFFPKNNSFLIRASVNVAMDQITSVVSGNGYDYIDSSIEGGIATEWKINRLSDNSLMASGLGPNAVISFVGAAEWYSIVFKSPYGLWGTPTLFYANPGDYITINLDPQGCSFAVSYPT